MLKTILDNWEGEIEINDVKMSADEIASKIDFNTLQNVNSVTLLTNTSTAFKTRSDAIQSIDNNTEEVTITVKQYMTQKSTLAFDFMYKWNNDVPMPMRTMTGVVVKETQGMVYMKLHGLAKPTITCMICGKELTNPVSRLYGIGPICLGKVGIVRDISDVAGIKEEMQNITWEGWIIKSAIIKKEGVNDEM